jgi:hypothetical protein
MSTRDYWYEYMKQVRADRYAWALKVDPAAVAAFEAKALAERTAKA